MSFGDWATSCSGQNDVRRLFIAVSGYEARSRHWFESIVSAGLRASCSKVLICGFKEHRKVLSRSDNDTYYETNGCEIVRFGADSAVDFHRWVSNQVAHFINESVNLHCEVHIDFSSMPRSWYCKAPFILDAGIRESDDAYLWYTPGKYVTSTYPTAGVNDFCVFSGIASLAPAFRTHFMGLGFDKIRSHAIWSVIDPENLVAFYADPASVDEYVNRVRDDNEDVLRSAQHVITLPLNDVAFCINRLIATVREFRRLGDVILVPDGPKPLILAASLVPSLIGLTGVVCFHVARKRTESIEPVDVAPNGDPVALRFRGSKNTTDVAPSIAFR